VCRDDRVVLVHDATVAPTACNSLATAVTGLQAHAPSSCDTRSIA
jgi:hypothetical protein